MTSTLKGGVATTTTIITTTITITTTTTILFTVGPSRFTFAEFCYALLLVSDDLSNEQLMSCNNAERILAKRSEAQDTAAAAASSQPATPAASSPKPKSVQLEADDSPSAPDHQDTPRSSRLLLFLQVRSSGRLLMSCSDFTLRRAFCCRKWRRFHASLSCRQAAACERQSILAP